MILAELARVASSVNIPEWLSSAAISLLTLAIALPFQAKQAQSKALETVQKVYSGMFVDLRKEVADLRTEVAAWKQKHEDSHCANASKCKNRVK